MESLAEAEVPLVKSIGAGYGATNADAEKNRERGMG